jgi:hypothetical protein
MKKNVARHSVDIDNIKRLPTMNDFQTMFMFQHLSIEKIIPKIIISLTKKTISNNIKTEINNWQVH